MLIEAFKLGWGASVSFLEVYTVLELPLVAVVAVCAFTIDVLLIEDHGVPGGLLCGYKMACLIRWLLSAGDAEEVCVAQAYELREPIPEDAALYGRSVAQAGRPRFDSAIGKAVLSGRVREGVTSLFRLWERELSFFLGG